MVLSTIRYLAFNPIHEQKNSDLTLDFRRLALANSGTGVKLRRIAVETGNNLGRRLVGT